MTLQNLPDRPNLEQLKNQAKTLLHEARAKDAGALSRFQILPTMATKSLEELSAASLALHDAQSVIAREYGFKSWNRLRAMVELLVRHGADRKEQSFSLWEKVARSAG